MYQSQSVFDEVFKDLKGVFAVSGNYPPTDVYKVEGGIIVEVAAAGFTKNQLSVAFDGSVLKISTRDLSAVENDGRVYIARGIAKRQFERKINFTGSYALEYASFKDGILKVFLKNTFVATNIDILDDEPDVLINE